MSAAIDTIEFRRARDNAEDSVRFCGLFNSLYRRRVDRRYYRWQYFETPFPSLLAFASDPAGELAGCYGYQLRESNLDRRSIAWAIDIMVAPAWQGSGLFRRLANYAAAEAQAHDPIALCVMANSRAYPAHVRGLEWTLISEIDTFFADDSDLAEADGIQFSPLDDFGRLHGFGEPPPSAFRASTRRSAAFLNWRFKKNPWHSYECYGIERHGYVVLKVFQDPITGIRYGDLVDHSWSRDLDAWSDRLLKFAVQRFRGLRVERTATWFTRGLRTSMPPRFFCGKVLVPEFSWLEDPARWFLTMADSEIY